jgi:hypothetical protein
MIKEPLAFLLENSCSESSTLVLETLNLQSSWITLLLTYGGDASCRSNFAEEDVMAVLFCSWASIHGCSTPALFLVVAGHQVRPAWGPQLWGKEDAVQGWGAGSQTRRSSSWQSWRLGTGGGECDGCGAPGGAHGRGVTLEGRKSRGTDDGMQRPGAMQMASRVG